MDPKPISDIIKKPISELQTQESKPSVSGDTEKLLECVKSKKINECSYDEVKEQLRLVMMKVGIRASNLPNDLEKLVLYEHIQKHFGGNHLPEIKLAFELAIAGKLGLRHEDISSYENFSCLYFSKIMNAYRAWSGEEHRMIEKYLPPPKEEQKLLESVVEDQPHWGRIIEQEYQHFLSFGEENWKRFPVGFYDQLVKDEVFDKDLFRKAMISVRKKAVGKLWDEKHKLLNANFGGVSKERIEIAQSIHKTNLATVEKNIEEYNTGAKDGELEVIAKQYCVLHYFRQSKEALREHIYQPA